MITRISSFSPPSSSSFFLQNPETPLQPREPQQQHHTSPSPQSMSNIALHRASAATTDYSTATTTSTPSNESNVSTSSQLVSPTSVPPALHSQPHHQQQHYNHQYHHLNQHHYSQTAPFSYPPRPAPSQYYTDPSSSYGPQTTPTTAYEGNRQSSGMSAAGSDSNGESSK